MQGRITKPGFHIHPLVQDTDNTGPAILEPIKQEVGIDGELEHTRPDIIDGPAGLGACP